MSRAGGGGRRPPMDPYYDDYDDYGGNDWMRIIVGALASIVLIMGIVTLGVYLWNRVSEETTQVAASPTATPVPTVPVYICAADPEPVGDQVAPSPLSIAGRTADNRWLAFANPAVQPRQLWIRASDLDTFDPTTVGVVRCAITPDEFPTPIGQLAVPEEDTGGTDDAAEDGAEDGGEDTAGGAVDDTADGEALPTPVPLPTNTPAPLEPEPTEPPAEPTPTPELIEPDPTDPPVDPPPTDPPVDPPPTDPPVDPPPTDPPVDPPPTDPPVDPPPAPPEELE